MRSLLTDSTLEREFKSNKKTDRMRSVFVLGLCSVYPLYKSQDILFNKSSFMAVERN